MYTRDWAASPAPSGPLVHNTAPAAVRIAIICDNFSPHLTTRNQLVVAEPEAQFTALRYFALDGTDHPTHKEQASMIRRTVSGVRRWY